MLATTYRRPRTMRLEQVAEPQIEHPNDAIVRVIRKNGGRELTRIELFDIFKESRAYSLEFRSAEKTLTDDEVGAAFQRIVESLKATAGIEVREG